jgi:hypothetical protein
VAFSALTVILGLRLGRLLLFALQPLDHFFKVAVLATGYQKTLLTLLPLSSLMI